MRFQVKLKVPENTILPFNYNYYLVSSIYNLIEKSDPEYSKNFHDLKKYKFFTFSEILIKNRDILKDGILIRDKVVDLIISSPNEQFLKNLINGILIKKIFNIKDRLFKVVSIKEYISPRINFFKTLSPVYVYEKKGNKIIDILPNDQTFKKALLDILYKKYFQFYGLPPENVRKWYIDIISYKQKRIKFKKNLFFRCSHIKFKFYGLSEKEFNFLLDCGIGSRTSLGFGCLDTYVR